MESDDNLSTDEGPSPRPAKLGAFVDDDAAPAAAPCIIQCSLAPHRDPLGFASAADFELHYAKEHSNRCLACGKNFPTAHFLALHTDENHNAFRQALQAKGEKTYACFVEDCPKSCSSPQKRRLHLIDKHLFPKNYNFRIVDSGIDKSISMLRDGRRRRVSTTADQLYARIQPGRDFKADRDIQVEKKGTAIDNTAASATGHPEARSANPTERPGSKSTHHVSDASMNDLDQSMAALRFVPPSVTSRQQNNPRSS
ncbi:hypothetical protein B0A52_08256 [Exophiala mesophila]|uniref:C2H2-type domain-containing protein n=1 Tax=Exophiala mesophila TaxID=212818 RepID=A0A438MYT5_EXOME|nr:hypothetical protein B0A52_08256 [Exophiala mesophila]